MAYDGYIRVSRVAGREGERFISPDQQREHIHNWAKLAGVDIAEIHADMDMSGAKRDRPGLLAALDRVESGQSEGIVVAKLDRLARSLPLALDAITRIEDAGGQLIAVQDGIDPRTSTGKMARSILLVIADWYREQIREQWTSARSRAVKRGVSVASTVATGYVRGSDGRLHPDPAIARVVHEVFVRRAAGGGWAELAELMNSERVPVKYAGRGNPDAKWRGQTVSRLVANPVYRGEVRHGEFVNPDAHEAIVTPALWHAAQQARGTSQPTVERPSLLAGLVRCGGCGYSMHRSTGRGAGGSVMALYRCRGLRAHGDCPSRAHAPAWILEGWLTAEYLRLADGLPTLIAGQQTGDLTAALEDLADAEHVLAAYRDNGAIIKAIGVDGYTAGLEVHASAVDDARVRVHAARLPTSGVPEGAVLRGMWPDLSIIDRRRLLTAALDCVVVSGGGRTLDGRVRFCWRGTAPGDLPKRGSPRNALGPRPIDLDGLPGSTRPTLRADLSEDA